MTQNIEDKLKKTNMAHSKLQSAIGGLESEIANSVTFEFSINFQSSDGFCVCDSDGNLAPIKGCIKIISENGLLSKNDFLTICI